MVKTAVLGFAHGHINGIANEWIKHPEYGVELASGWDADEKRRKAACESLKIPECAALGDILNDKTVEAVIIGSETLYHSELAVKAADAGKKIILYKPCALTLSQADDIVKAVEQIGRASFIRKIASYIYSTY